MTLRPAVASLRSVGVDGRVVRAAVLGAAILAALTVLSWFARAQAIVSPNPTALASLQAGLGNHTGAITVQAGSVRMVARLVGGEIWPSRPIAAGTRVTIQIETHAWLWNPWSQNAVSSLVLVAPKAPTLTRQHLLVTIGHHPAISLSGISAGLRLRTSSSHPWATLDGTAHSFYAPVIGARPGEHSSLVLRTRARTWEAWAPPERVQWATPAYLTADAVWTMRAGQPLLTLRFSMPVARLPQGAVTMSPNMAGTWTRASATSWAFVPAAGTVLYPGQAVPLRLEGGSAGIRAQSGSYLARSLRSSSAMPLGTVLRAQELLASLGYLPLSWSGPAASTPSEQLAAAYSPNPGSFQWRYADTPTLLRAQWAPGQLTPMTTGAVMTFEAQAGLAADGLIGPQVWKALILAADKNETAATAYSWVYVSETLPERLSIWQSGRIVLTSLTNTGIPATPTALGTYPVYLRYTSQTMSGVNPNGTPYVDPGIPWVNYFSGGDAVHGFVRAQYGFPQSLGCVELPIAEAAIAWQHMQYGTLVTVEPPGSAHLP